jgi:hypothetical protein
VGIDPAREERFQPRVDARAAERLLDQRVEAEPRQVPFVEHNRMAQLDRPLVIDAGVEEIEQRARARAVPPVPGDGRFAIKHPLIVIHSRCDCRLR